jgi:hypothetical protein
MLAYQQRRLKNRAALLDDNDFAIAEFTDWHIDPHPENHSCLPAWKTGRRTMRAKDLPGP